jgi:decaprenylphospho-beta-D-ribofuranose 2-oxidase
VEWAMTVPPVPALAWWIAYRFLYPDGKRFVDDLEGFTFFMDGNRRAKRIARAFGWRPKTVQQTFILPSDGPSPGDDLVRWLEYAHDHLSGLGLAPTLQDILWLPEDLPFRLSATAGTPGFAVSYAFETSDHDVVESAKVAFTDMAEVLWREFGGRVYLVKNVCARSETLAAMYGHNAVEFFVLKDEVDPSGTLANGFLERTFGEPRTGRPGARLAPEG